MSSDNLQFLDTKLSKSRGVLRPRVTMASVGSLHNAIQKFKLQKQFHERKNETPLTPKISIEAKIKLLTETLDKKNKLIVDLEWQLKTTKTHLQDKEAFLETMMNENTILKSSINRSHEECDEFHGKLNEVQLLCKQLKQDLSDTQSAFKQYKFDVEHQQMDTQKKRTQQKTQAQNKWRVLRKKQKTATIALSFMSANSNINTPKLNHAHEHEHDHHGDDHGNEDGLLLHEHERELQELHDELQRIEKLLQQEREQKREVLFSAEESQRTVSHLKEDIQFKGIASLKLEQEYEELRHNHQIAIEEFQHSVAELENENARLSFELNEQQSMIDYHEHIQPRNRNESLEMNNSNQHDSNGSVQRISVNEKHGEEDDNIENLEDIGCTEVQEYNETPVISNRESEDFIVENPMFSDPMFSFSPDQLFRDRNIDAQEEFIQLTIIAAKIKFCDVPITTATLLQKIKDEKIYFHEVADWLNRYLSKERQKCKKIQKQMKRKLQKQQHSTTNSTNSVLPAGNNISPGQKLLKKMKSLATTNHSSMRLECRFGRRVFEVKMKKTDRLRTLLQTLPRIIGEDAETMMLFKANIALNPKLTLVDNGLEDNDVIRMMHEKSVNSFLRKYNRKLDKQLLLNSADVSTNTTVSTDTDDTDTDTGTGTGTRTQTQTTANTATVTDTNTTDGSNTS